MNDFATEFEALFRTTYLKAARRVRDKRDRLSPETIALLDHMAMAGPLTLSELARHIGRAPSTLSEMLDHVEAKGLIDRERDPADGRRTLIWLSSAGQAALSEARQVLDADTLNRAAADMPPAERTELLRLFHCLTSRLKGSPHEP